MWGTVLRSSPKTKRKRKNKIMTRAMLQIDNRKERSKLQINGIFDGKNKKIEQNQIPMI